MKTVPKRVAASMLSMAMAMNVMSVPTFAAHNDQDAANMNPKTIVYEIGKKSYYKLNTDGTISFADREESGEYEAVPSAYIYGSKYNTKDTGAAVLYGMYQTSDGKIHYVEIADCLDNGVADDGLWLYDHGTSDGATVSDEVDTATNDDNQISTQFYLNIENGIADGWENLDEVVVAGTDAHDRVSYEVVVATSTDYQLNVTVPMYVCMYGYRGTGNVVTPTDDAYQMKNYSTINENSDAYVKSIVKLTQYTQILDKDHSNETLYAIAYDEDSNTYTWWYSEPTVDMSGYTSVFNLAENNYEINASGENYVIYIDGTWKIAAAGTLDNGVLRESVDEIDEKHPLGNDLTVGDWNFGTEFTVEDKGAWEGEERTEGLAVRIDEVQAEPATWRLVDADTSASALKRGELIMTLAPEYASEDVSALDLADYSASKDISERGWLMAKPSVVDGQVTDPTVMGLKTSAQMAGGDVNEAGCTPVVKVSYTVVPQVGETGVAENLVESN